MSQPIEPDYSDKPAIVIKIVVAVEAVVSIIKEKDTAPQVALSRSWKFLLRNPENPYGFSLATAASDISCHSCIL